MAPSWSACLSPACPGVVSVKQTDWEHICAPCSSAEASPDSGEQAGLFSAPSLSAKFPALLETCGQALLWQRREGTGRVRKHSALGSCLQQLATGEGSSHTPPKAPQEIKSGTVQLHLPLELKQMGPRRALT